MNTGCIKTSFLFSDKPWANDSWVPLTNPVIPEPSACLWLDDRQCMRWHFPRRSLPGFAYPSELKWRSNQKRIKTDQLLTHRYDFLKHVCLSWTFYKYSPCLVCLFLNSNVPSFPNFEVGYVFILGIYWYFKNIFRCSKKSIYLNKTTERVRKLRLPIVRMIAHTETRGHLVKVWLPHLQ